LCFLFFATIRESEARGHLLSRQVATAVVRTEGRPYRPTWWTDNVESARRKFVEKKSQQYRNGLLWGRERKFQEMSAARDKLKAEIENARLKSWRNFVGDDPLPR
jgi:hypothetical protein